MRMNSFLEFVHRCIYVYATVYINAPFAVPRQKPSSLGCCWPCGVKGTRKPRASILLRNSCDFSRERNLFMCVFLHLMRLILYTFTSFYCNLTLGRRYWFFLPSFFFRIILAKIFLRIVLLYRLEVKKDCAELFFFAK